MPENWLLKRLKKYELLFIDSCANSFKNAEQVKKYLLTNGTQEDLETFTEFCTTLGSGIKNSNSKVMKDEELDDSWTQIPSLPSGWMTKKINFGHNPVSRLRSPDGHVLQGKKKALKFMVNEKYPSDQIEGMRNVLKGDGWQPSPHLPQDSMFKILKGQYLRVEFLSSSGDYFRNKETTLNYLKSNGFEDYFITNVAQFNSKIDKVTREPARSPPGPPGPAKIRTKEDGWAGFDSEELSGWRHKPGQQKYLSPAGVYLNGRVELLKFMVNNNFSKEQVLAMKNVTKSIKN